MNKNHDQYLFHWGQCREHARADYLEFGGSFGFDSSKMMVADAICGTGRNASKLRRIQSLLKYARQVTFEISQF